MAELPTPQDERTRANISYMYVIGALVLLGYTLYRWGDKMEILTLIIGLIGGSLLSPPNSVFFGGSTAKKDSSTPTVTQTGENPQVTVNPSEPTPPVQP